MLRLLLAGLFILSVNGKKEEDLRKVHVKGQGNVLGMKFWDGEFYEFYGIPYASAPTGRDRFKPPLPPKSWEEDMKANKGMLLCQQVYFSSREDEGDLLYGEEDCLGVSFMVPKIASQTNLVPVIAYVHSGAYAGGNSNMARYHHLARQDVIVANFNYRLGALGFACLGTEDIPGNAALKDIIAALKWIKEHVKSFGGDPDNITLAGFSIGASLAELVALSSESNGLFDKLMLDSGSALTPFAVNRDPIHTAKNIAISIGYEDTGDIEDLNEFLLEADIKDLLGASRNYFLKNSTFGFTPCIENPNNPGAVLTESPLDTLKKGNYGNFALVTGFANMEGISRTSQFDAWRGEMNENLAPFLPADLAFKTDKERDNFIKELKEYYFNGKPITLDSVQGYIDYFSDSMFTYSILKSAKLHGANLKRPIYVYEFTYVGKLNTQHAYMDRIRGASHRDASAYVLDFFDWTRNYTDMDMRDLMTFMWGDFLKHEDPTAYESPLLNIKWLKYKDDEPNYLDFGDKLVMKKNPFKNSYQLWDKAYNKHYWNPTVVNPDAYKGKGGKTAAKTKPVAKKPVVDPAAPKASSPEPAVKKPATADDADKKPVASNPPKTTDSKAQDTAKSAEKKVDANPKNANTQKPEEDKII